MLLITPIHFTKNTIKNLREKGEFGQKLYDYIYTPAVEEKYDLLNKVLQGVLTAEDAESLQSKQIELELEKQSYKHCIEIKNTNIVNSDRSFDNNKTHYYCYNDTQPILIHIAIGNPNDIEIIEYL